MEERIPPFEWHQGICRSTILYTITFQKYQITLNSLLCFCYITRKNVRSKDESNAEIGSNNVGKSVFSVYLGSIPEGCNTILDSYITSNGRSIGALDLQIKFDLTLFLCEYLASNAEMDKSNRFVFKCSTYRCLMLVIVETLVIFQFNSF